MSRLLLSSRLTALAASSTVIATMVCGASASVAAPTGVGAARAAGGPASVTAGVYLRDRDGKPLTESNTITLADMVNLTTGDQERIGWAPGNDHLQASAPPGHYYIEADVQVEDPKNPSDYSTLVLIKGDVVVDSHHTTVTLDGRGSVPITGRAPSHPDAAVVGVGLLIQQTVAGKTITTGDLATFGDTPRAWITPVPHVSGRPFAFLAHVRLAKPGSSTWNGPGTTPTTYLYSLTNIWHGAVPSNLTLRGDDARLATITNTFHATPDCQQGPRCFFAPQFDDLPVLASGATPFAWAVRVPADGTVVEHASPTEGFVWKATFRSSGARHPRTQSGPPEHYRAGSHYTHHWTV